MARRCVDCGRRHDGDRRCCPSCSGPPLRADGGEDVEGSDGEESDGEPFESIVWVCPECGREHQKHSPPCSRCGNVTLEKQRKVHADIETPGGTSYLDVLELKYALGYLAVIGFVVLVALSLAGVVSVPWLGGPSPPGAPGDAETYANVSLEAVEETYVDAINDARADSGLEPLSVGDALDGAATAFNQRRVRAATGDGAVPERDEIPSGYEPDCRPEPLLDTQTAPATDVFPNNTASANAVAGNLPIVDAAAIGEQLGDGYRSIGVDVHVAPDDTVYATVIFC